jgi:hypothetical protein
MASNIPQQQLHNESKGVPEQTAAPAHVHAANPVTPPAAAGAGPILLPEALKARLRAQVEFYFSQQNLSRDMYLRNCLLQYGGAAVPLSVICNFPKVRDLCMSYNVPAEPILIMHALEGSTVAYITPDAIWISPMQPLPPIDATAKMRPAQLGTALRSLSISSMPDVNVNINGNSSPPSSPSRSATAPGNVTSQPLQGQGQGQGLANGSHQQRQQQQHQQNGRPAMVARSHSHSGHYGQSVPMGRQLPPGMPGPAQGYLPYNYPYLNMPQPGYMYPPTMQSHGHPPGASQIQYQQMYPGYTYVSTTVATGPHKYFTSGRPVLHRGTSGNSATRLGPYDNLQRRNGPPMNSGVPGARRPDGSNVPGPAGLVPGSDPAGQKQLRKSKKKGVQNYDSGMQHIPGMASKGPNGQLTPQEDESGGGGGGGNLGGDNTNMPRNRSQNEISDSSGGKAKRKNNKSKTREGSNDRRKDVSFDANQFPALNPTKAKEASEKPPVAAMSGYAAVLLANKTSPQKDANDNDTGNAAKEVLEVVEAADVSKSVNAMNLSSEDTKMPRGSNPGVVTVGVMTGIPSSETHASVVESAKGAGIRAEIVDKVVIVEVPTSKETKDEGTPEAKSNAGSVGKADEPLGKESAAPAAPPAAWGNKRSFIDVVRKQP